MPVKYECKKCATRFVEWGAEKNEFKCPFCPDEALFRVGASLEEKAPSLKRRKPAKKKKAAPKKPKVKPKKAPKVIDAPLEQAKKKPELTEDGLVLVKKANGDIPSEGDATGTPTSDE